MWAVHDFLLINEAIIYWLFSNKKKNWLLYFLLVAAHMNLCRPMLEFIAVNFTPARHDYGFNFDIDLGI